MSNYNFSHTVRHSLPLLTILIGQALAAEPVTSGSLDPVVVSATRSEQNSFVLPMAVDAVDGERLRDGQAGVNLSETLNRIPGLVVQNRQNYAQDLQVSIRGFGSRSTFGTRGVRLLVDDIPASSPDGQGQAATFDLDSAKRIEVLRGPFATIYGNASGGVIRAISRDGPAHPEVEFGLLEGSFGAEKKSFEAGGQVSAMNYLIDASEFSTQGYRQHSAARREQTNAKFSIPTDPNGKLTLVVDLLGQPDTLDPTGLTAAEFASNPRQADVSALRWNSRKTINHEQVGANYQRNLGADDDLQVTVYTGARRVLQYLSSSSQTATASNAVVNLDRQFSGTDAHLTHRGEWFGGHGELSFGGSYELQNENRKGFDSLLSGGTTVAGTLKRSEGDEVTAANVYLQGQWAPSPGWLLVGGIRHSLVEFSTAAYLPYNPANGTGSIPGSAQYSNTSPALGLSFQPMDTVSVYANYGRGFETPAFSELAYTPVVSQTGAGNVTQVSAGPGLNFGLSPSTSDNYEIGSKLLLGEATRANAAMFHIVTRNELAVFANVNGRSYYQNVPGTLRNGLELSAEHDLLPALTVYGALTWLDATYSSAYKSLSISGTGANATVTPTTVTAGSHLPGLGRRIAYGELAWHDKALSAAIEARYSDKVYANDTNSAAAGTWTVVNLRAGLHQQFSGWRLEEFARVDNLLSRVYSGSVIVNDTNARYYEPAPTRAVMGGVRARYDF